MMKNNQYGTSGWHATASAWRFNLSKKLTAPELYIIVFTPDKNEMSIENWYKFMFHSIVSIGWQ